MGLNDRNTVPRPNSMSSSTLVTTIPAAFPEAAIRECRGGAKPKPPRLLPAAPDQANHAKNCKAMPRAKRLATSRMKTSACSAFLPPTSHETTRVVSAQIATNVQMSP